AKFASPDSDVPYRTVITYTLVLSNTGGDDPAVLLTDTLPAETDFAGWIDQSGATIDNDGLAWSGAVNAGTPITITFLVTNTADGGATVTNTVQFSGTTQTGSAEATYTTSRNMTASGSGNWSDIFLPCTGECNYVIPAGVTITLDQNIDLSGNLTIEGGGTLDTTTNHTTVTLTGSSDQTLTGDFTFYRLTVNKDNATDTVTINGSLKVQSKMRVRTGELVSASQYADVDIDASGTLSLTNVISVSGNMAITGTLSTNGWGIIFNGAKEQNLTLNTGTSFDDITVITGTTLIETNSYDYVWGVGTITNYGTIRKSQPVNATGYYYFGLAGIYPDYNALGMEIEVTDLSGGDPLTAIQVDRIDKAHPNAPRQATDIYWTITPTGSNYTATVTLPYTNVTNPLACRYTGSSWDCANDDSDVDYVTYADTSTFSDWAVFENQMMVVDDPNESTSEDTAVSISPLDNDVLLAGSSNITVSTVGSPSNGTAVISGSTHITYTPTANWSGTDVFTYTAFDGALTDTATITVTVSAVNDAPIITNSTPVSVTMSEDGNPIAFSLTLNAIDADTADTLTWSIVGQAGNGTASASGTGSNKSIGYTPTANWHGSDSFTVQVSD
ncbi:MAG: cadherin-like domain-containing protein, partial [Anaerolineales bacterium]|nr:cadherin-like domain-containing protein [Anaerolineales bacterium]